MVKKVVFVSIALMSVVLSAMERTHYLRVENGEVHVHAYVQRQEQELRDLKNKFCEQCQRAHGRLFVFCDVALKNLEKFRARQPEIIEFSGNEELERIFRILHELLISADRVKMDMCRVTPCWHLNEDTSL